MPEELPGLSKAEYEIMKVVWDTQGLTTGDILKAINIAREEPVSVAAFLENCFVRSKF